MAATLRAGFLVGYGAALVVLVARVLPAAARVRDPTHRAGGTARWLPVVLLPVGFLLPPLAMLTRLGELDVGWAPVRIVGVVCGLYAAGMLLASAATLGRFLVPQAVAQRDHVLVTSGPYALVRHPAYSGDLALWLGAALATVNVLLLGLFPLYALGAYAQSQVEEDVLRARFGREYADYAARVGRFVPTVHGAGAAVARP